MTKPTIRITIADDRSREQCEANCGMDWSTPETVNLARQGIKEKFGDRVTLEYLDLAQPDPNRYTLELKQQVKDNSRLLPLLLINGQTRISGQFDIRRLIDVIEVEIEIK